MARKIENGRVYRLKTQLDLKPLLKKEERYYKRLKPLHAMYFVAVYKATSKRTYFAPLCRKKCKKA